MVIWVFLDLYIMPFLSHGISGRHRLWDRGSSLVFSIQSWFFLALCSVDEIPSIITQGRSAEAVLRPAGPVWPFHLQVLIYTYCILLWLPWKRNNKDDIYLLRTKTHIRNTDDPFPCGQPCSNDLCLLINIVKISIFFIENTHTFIFVMYHIKINPKCVQYVKLKKLCTKISRTKIPYWKMSIFI